jgi:Fe-S cluster assembly iron-binding protein IscA
MNIRISDSAREYLRRREGFFRSRNRYARILLTELGCSGARFGLHWDLPSEQDAVLTDGEVSLIVDKALLERFEGFDLEAERFFFATRISVKPRRDSFECGCQTKCKQEVL